MRPACSSFAFYTYIAPGNIQHSSDSIQGTDYIVNYFFLNLRASRTKIENLKRKTQCRHYSVNLISRILSPPFCHFRFSIFVLETLKFKKKFCNAVSSLN